MKRLLLLLVAAGCGNPALADAPKPDACSAAALGLGKAKLLDAWKPPADCAMSGDRKPTQLPTEADARARLTCKDPKAKLGVDFKTSSLVVTSRSWSPAQVGLAVFDDGNTITLVSRQRMPCKDDPRPMPTPAITSVFLAGTGARKFAESSCNVETKCK